MTTKWMLFPKAITTAVRLALAFMGVMPAVILASSDQAHVRFLQFRDQMDPTAGFALLVFTGFLASHRLRRVDLVNDFTAFCGSMGVARKIILRDAEIGEFLVEVSGHLKLKLRSSMEKCRAVVRDLGGMTYLRMPLSQ